MVRAAETMTVFALMVSLLQPLIHAGRPWRIFYWVFPYDWARGIWPDVRSPLVWDPTAIITYLTSSMLFVYTALIPDLAIIRDRSTGWRRTVYGICRSVGTAIRVSGSCKASQASCCPRSSCRYSSRCTASCRGTSESASCRRGT